MENNRVLPLQRKFKNFFVKLPLQFSMFIWGLPGSGKTTFCMEFLNDLRRFGRVAYISTEEISGAVTVVQRYQRLNIKTDRVPFYEAETLENIEKIIDDEKPRFVLIDSITLLDCKLAELIKFITKCYRANISLIIVAHAEKRKNGAYLGSAKLAHKVDIDLKAENGTIQISHKNRFAKKGNEIFNIY